MLRIKSYGLIYKAIEEDTDRYENEIDEYNQNRSNCHRTYWQTIANELKTGRIRKCLTYDKKALVTMVDVTHP